MCGTCSTNEEMRNAYRLLVGKPEGKRPLGRKRRRWVNNIKMDLGETVLYGVVCSCMAQCRDNWRDLLTAIIGLRFLVKCWESTEWLHHLWHFE
jgi:hypothetical protein